MIFTAINTSRKLLVLAAMLFASSSQAHNKVVVIPLLEDAPLKPFAPLAVPGPPDSAYLIHAKTVVDNTTGREWQRIDDTVSRDWNAAWDYCATLSLDGKRDWRLPDIGELVSIASYAHASPSINAVAFPSTASSGYWSGTAVASTSARAWAVIFTLGVTSDKEKTGYQRVRCIR